MDSDGRTLEVGESAAGRTPSGDLAVILTLLAGPVSALSWGGKAIDLGMLCTR